MKKIKKEHKEEIMKKIKKAGDPENYEVSWDTYGIPKIIKKKSEIKKGKLSRARGARFELKVREDMESKGWIMDKWNNNVDLESGKLIKAKRKYNPYKKILVIGTGFPDFIAFRRLENYYEVIGIEVKINGILSKTEKERCRWLLNNKIFSRILIAKKGQKRGEIEYVDFHERYEKS